MNHCKLIITSLSILSFAATASSQEATPEAVFETRLKPIFNSPDPSSCIQCHLAAVDLKNYILPTSRETFISLRDQGLVNTQHPDESKILHLISMGDSDPDILSQRIHAKNRKREYDAFSHWIKACCQNEDLLAAKPLEINKKAGPVLSNAVIRHARTDRVLDSFIRNVWSQRMRCFPCHTPAELDSGNPMHKKPIQRHRDIVRQYGARMNIFKKTPLETMRGLIASSRIKGNKQEIRNGDLPLINLEEPALSLLVEKPTAKLPAKKPDGGISEPSSSTPVSHMGGVRCTREISRTKLGCTGSRITPHLYMDAMNLMKSCRQTTGIRRSTSYVSRAFQSHGQI
ncbi:MAG: hypothetical protein ACR2OA_09675 [Rubripirellula sp.]